MQVQWIASASWDEGILHSDLSNPIGWIIQCGTESDSLILSVYLAVNMLITFIPYPGLSRISLSEQLLRWVVVQDQTSATMREPEVANDGIFKIQKLWEDEF